LVRKNGGWRRYPFVVNIKNPRVFVICWVGEGGENGGIFGRGYIYVGT
jgi:hypothetical protein